MKNERPPRSIRWRPLAIGLNFSRSESWMEPLEDDLVMRILFGSFRRYFVGYARACGWRR